MTLLNPVRKGNEKMILARLLIVIAVGVAVFAPFMGSLAIVLVLLAIFIQSGAQFRALREDLIELAKLLERRKND